MTNQVDNHPPRIFKYGDKNFPDPGPAYSVEQVLAHLRTFSPSWVTPRQKNGSYPTVRGKLRLASK